jgi:geranylgeranyl pyrophosphate synthase
MIAHWMDSRGAFSQAERLAASHISDAIECTEQLPNSSATALLATVANYVVRRQA